MKGQGRRTYYIATEKLRIMYGYDVNGGTSGANGGTSDANGGTSLAANLPPQLKERIKKLGKRVSKQILFDTIVELCRVRPYSGDELAQVLHRTESHIKNKIIPELLGDKRIQFVYPEMKNHPNQKYIAK